MIRRPPRSTLTYTLCPYTTLFRSLEVGIVAVGNSPLLLGNPVGGELQVSDFDGRWARGWPPVLLSRRSEEHTSELQSLMRISYAVFCLKKKNIYMPHSIAHRRATLYTIIGTDHYICLHQYQL